MDIMRPFLFKKGGARMKEFKGFDDWIAIFKGGPQRDSRGRMRNGDELIDKAIAVFDPAYHEPPLVAGHPKDNAPAFGWVAGLKKAGNVLYAKFKDVVPEFARAVKDGLYKKRSAAFYPDGRLRHVGFLGAAPPAIKGLADLKFEEGQEAFSFEYADPPDTTRTFTEADLEAVRQEERRKVEAEFTEKAFTEEVSSWSDRLLREGKIIPAWIKMGFKEFALGLDREEAYEFAEEGYERGQITRFQWFKDFIEELPKVITFGETATRDTDFQGGEASEKLARLTEEKMKENEGMSYSEAFTQIQNEHPDLARECRLEMTN